MDDSETAATIATVERFGNALNRRDIDGVIALMTDDCVFENTSPAPDGERFVGQAAVRAFWESMLRSSPSFRFETEECFAAGNRCTTRWLYQYVSADGNVGHIRGVDLFKVRDGKVAEKLAYVKG